MNKKCNMQLNNSYSIEKKLKVSKNKTFIDSKKPKKISN